AAGGVEEDEVAQVLDHDGLAIVSKGEVDGPAGEGNSLAGGMEDLVGRHDDPTIGLHADRESVVLLRACARIQEGKKETQDRPYRQSFARHQWFPIVGQVSKFPTCPIKLQVVRVLIVAAPLLLSSRQALDRSGNFPIS